MVGRILPAFADTHSMFLELSVPRQASYNSLVKQAEFLASQAITNYFSNNPGMSAVQVTVLGDRNGNLAPLLTATVSRAQWQKQASISVWAQYYTAQAVLQRQGGGNSPDTPGVPGTSGVPDTPGVPGTSGTPVAIFLNSEADVDRAFDEGRLTGELAQEYLSKLD